MLLTQTSRVDYEDLCKLDVLGLAVSPSGDQSVVYDEFKEQLRRSEEGWYETGLPRKGNHTPLPNNKEGSLRGLASLVRKLEKNGSIEDYNAVIQEQLIEGIVERAPKSRLLARRPSSRPKDGQFSELGDFRRPVLGGHLRTSVLNVTKQCL